MRKTLIALFLLAALIATVLLIHRDAPITIAITRYAVPSAITLQEVMQGIYDADAQFSSSGSYQVRAAIVPHHLTAHTSIAAGVKMGVSDHPRTVLLLSPDHFFGCPTVACTTNGVFETALGQVKSDGAAVDRLAESPLVTTDPSLFEKEHGIYTILPFLAHYAPSVRVIPVVLSQKRSWLASRAELATLLESLMDEDTVLIVSSDFSHYLSVSEADAKDEETAKTFFAHDMDGIAALENPSQSDCPSCLWVLATIAGERGFFNPSILLHTNAARLVGDTTAKETTSHFSMAFYQNAVLSPEDLAVGGDITITRPRRTPTLSPVLAAFWNGNGPRFVNLEGPLADVPCPPTQNQFIFCNQLAVWSRIRGFATFWGVENNHMLDQGTGGKLRTMQLLTETKENPVSTAIVDSGSLRLLSVTLIHNPTKDGPGAEIAKGIQQTLTALRLHPKDDDALTVVLVHGGTEYSAFTPVATEARLREFIDAGADAVVLAHSHVIGDTEIYHGKPILRGIGNFVFDQYFSVPTQTTKLVRLRKQEGKVLFETVVGRQ